MDMENVIKGLEICAEHGSWHGLDCEHNEAYKDCPYRGCETGCIVTIAKDALSLLKEQEARILDWDELEDWENAVWFDDKDEHECYIAIIANVGTYDAKFVNVEPGMVHRLDFLREFYKKEWRCWSARPTIKQRQAVKWG